MTMPRFAIFAVTLCMCGPSAFADTPTATYIFPAGGHRGTTVPFRVGGCYLHDACPFEMLGAGVEAAPKIENKNIVVRRAGHSSTRFSGVRRLSQGSCRPGENRRRCAAGVRAWRIWTSQGAVPTRNFIVGDLPEIIEQESEGSPVPVQVKLPLTINGRVFPREDVDVWSFEARAGQSITCAAVAARLGSPFDVHLEIVDSQGRRIAESRAGSGVDALAAVHRPADGVYEAASTM